MRLCLVLAVAVSCFAQQPNAAAQREAMKKLEFLAGKWSGNASVIRGPGEPLKLTQSEDVQYKLDGLVMVVEGTGRNAAGEIVFRAFATIAYDDAAGVYRFRAYNDGRYLDTELTVAPNAFAWGFETGPAKINNAMHLSEKGEWIEFTEVTIGSQPPRKTLNMTLQKLPR